MKFYESSISSAQKHRFVHDEGLAHEKAAHSLRHMGEDKEA
jgi:hypothetical protein